VDVALVIVRKDHADGRCESWRDPSVPEHGVH
jgi:hypothetical protein